MTVARIHIRIDSEIKAMAKKAAALLGMNSLNEYIMRVIEKDARRIILEHESLVVRDEVFVRFMSACEDAEETSQKLGEARGTAKKCGICLPLV